MLKLNNITLVCIDDKNPGRGVNALKNSIKNIIFKEVRLFHSNPGFDSRSIPSILIKPITSKKSYSEFILKKLNKYIDTKYVLIIQWDGYILNPEAWDDHFLAYDYIGSVWPWDGIVGNGGFSLRSKKLLEICEHFNFKSYHPEDKVICRDARKELESKGIEFAPLEIAHKFSVENEVYTGQFGWHGGEKPKDYDKWLNEVQNEFK